MTQGDLEWFRQNQFMITVSKPYKMALKLLFFLTPLQSTNSQRKAPVVIH